MKVNALAESTYSSLIRVNYVSARAMSGFQPNCFRFVEGAFLNIKHSSNNSSSIQTDFSVLCSVCSMKQ